jgi:hypothetical protein
MSEPNQEHINTDGMWIIDDVPVPEKLQCPYCHAIVSVQHPAPGIWVVGGGGLDCTGCTLARNRLEKFLENVW